MSRSLAWLVLLMLLAQPAMAADENLAEQAHKVAAEAIEHYSAKRYEPALAGFEEARRIYRDDPILLYYLGRTHEKLGNAEQALERYEEYMEVGPLKENREQVEAAIARLRAQTSEAAFTDEAAPAKPRWQHPAVLAGGAVAAVAVGIVIWSTVSLSEHRDTMASASASGDYPSYLDAEHQALSDISTRRRGWGLLALAIPTMVVGFTW